jgi:hypothetical protein
MPFPQIQTRTTTMDKEICLIAEAKVAREAAEKNLNVE